MKGPRSVEDIKERCVVDDITGCWVWRGGFSGRASSSCRTPVMQAAVGVFGPKRTGIGVPKAVWLFTGKKLNGGHVVYRGCLNDACCNPEHLRSATRRGMFEFIAKSGKNKGNPERIAQCLLNRESTITPREKVAEAERLFAAGELQKNVAKMIGVDVTTARRIQHGLHPYNASRLGGVPGSSVFAWRPQ